MTKKDYIIIAEAINRFSNAFSQDLHDQKAHNTIRCLIAYLAKVMGEENPRFDKEKFYKATGYNDVPGSAFKAMVKAEDINYHRNLQ